MLTSRQVLRPWVYRASPFFFFIFLMALSGPLQHYGFDPKALYAVRAGLTGLLLWAFFRFYVELAWPPRLALGQVALSILLGVAVFLCWIQLDQGWMVLGEGDVFNPYGADGGMDVAPVVLRGLGSALIVPLMEELFWRSFLMRWIDRADFLGLSPLSVSLRALILSSLLFALEHTLWLAGLLAGLAYGWLYKKTSNLWAPVLAHTVTNATLALWVVATGSWKYW